MKFTRLPSLILAVTLQVLPMARMLYNNPSPVPSGFGVVFQWIVGTVALLGSYHAVSGASTVITSATTSTATNGVPYYYRITAGPEVPNTYSAVPLPPGLFCSTTSGKITGTPTQVGVTLVTIKASDNGKADRTTSAVLTLTIIAGSGGGTAPSISTQPASQTITAGGSATFSVVAAGTAPLGYQWRLNGTGVGGATNATYSMSNVQASQAGNYSVVVSNSVGTATSANALLTVNPPVVAPSITTQPASQTVTAGGNASFTVVASGTAPLSYQWRLNGSAIAGATSATLALSNVQAANAGTYSVIVSNSAGTATSDNATLTVNPAAVAPSVTTQPANQTVTVGGNASFSVVATGTAPLSYQWRLNGSAINGATSDSLNLSNVQMADAGTYSVVMSNSAGTATSANATLTVNLPIVAPSITTEPASQSVLVGGSASFSVGAAGTAPLAYQWRFNGSPVGNATSATLNLSNVQLADAGSYSVIVSNSAGTATSANATLTANQPVVAPSITTQPAGQTVTVGGSASFSVVASGTSPMNYEWLFNGFAISGWTNASLTLNNVQPGNIGSYSVIVRNAAGSVMSSSAALTFQSSDVPLSILTQPEGQTIEAGDFAVFWVMVSGSMPMNCQWQFNGDPIPFATNIVFVLDNVQTNQAGSYAVLVSNAAGSVMSSNAILTVQQTMIAPSITTQPLSQTVNVGESASFAVEASGTEPLAYQWLLNGSGIPGETNATLNLSNVQTSEAGAYSVIISNLAGAVTSDGAALTVEPDDGGDPGTTSSLSLSISGVGEATPY